MSVAANRSIPTRFIPWTDRAGSLSALKLGVFCALFVPALWLIVQATFGMLGGKPIMDAIHQSGDWAIRIFLVSLAVTPLRFVAQWPKLIAVRRMLGLGALAYALLHLTLYVVEQRYDIPRVVSEIFLRFYLTIGFAVILGLLALGITSTDGMVKRLGGSNWRRLHWLAYPLALMGTFHYLLQSKFDITQAVLIAGFLVWLLGFRLLRRWGYAISVRHLAVLALLAGLGTACIEAAWYAVRTGAPALKVLEANLSFHATIRPAWWVLAAGLGMVLIYFARNASWSPLRVKAAPARQRRAAA